MTPVSNKRIYSKLVNAKAKEFDSYNVWDSIHTIQYLIPDCVIVVRDGAAMKKLVPTLIDERSLLCYNIIKSDDSKILSEIIERDELDYQLCLFYENKSRLTTITLRSKQEYKRKYDYFKDVLEDMTKEQLGLFLAGQLYLCVYRGTRKYQVILDLRS